MKNIPKDCTVEKLPYHGEARCLYSGDTINKFCEMLKKKMGKYAYVETLWFDFLDLSWAVRGVGELTKVFSILGTTKANAAFAECGAAPEPPPCVDVEAVMRERVDHLRALGGGNPPLGGTWKF